ncbi:MAG: DUF4405 domain-containing protein [Anaerolineae bacterium]
MKRKALIKNPSKLNLFVDLVMALAFVTVMELRFTGLQIHELLGLAIAVAFLTHIILHWRWVVSVTLRFFKQLFHESRLNYVLNLALFVDLFIATLSGIVISRTLGLDFGSFERALPWERLHTLTADFSLMLVALHVALHWKWIVSHSKKYLFNFHLPRPKARNLDTQPVPVATSSQNVSAS